MQLCQSDRDALLETVASSIVDTYIGMQNQRGTNKAFVSVIAYEGWLLIGRQVDTTASTYVVGLGTHSLASGISDIYLHIFRGHRFLSPAPSNQLILPAETFQRGRPPPPPPLPLVSISAIIRLMYHVL